MILRGFHDDGIVLTSRVSGVDVNFSYSVVLFSVWYGDSVPFALILNPKSGIFALSGQASAQEAM